MFNKLPDQKKTNTMFWFLVVEMLKILKLKGFDIAARSVADLSDTRLVFCGSTPRKTGGDCQAFC